MRRKNSGRRWRIARSGEVLPSLAHPPNARGEPRGAFTRQQRYAQRRAKRGAEAPGQQTAPRRLQRESWAPTFGSTKWNDADSLVVRCVLVGGPAATWAGGARA